MIECARALLYNKALRVAGSLVTPAHLSGKNERQLLKLDSGKNKNILRLHLNLESSGRHIAHSLIRLEQEKKRS